jgi:DNA-binding NtrC family response regulator
MSDEAIGEILGSILVRRRDRTVLRPSELRPAELSRLGSFRSRSPAMQRVLEVARRVTSARSSVLILGETGVGKEHLARAIHEQGPRARHPFVAVNCAAIPDTLFESELFGHEQGAFTGASRAHRGHFEVAHGGTIFLDEIADTPAQVQAKLLRVLQDRKIQRVGAETTIPVDARVVAATNRDLEREIRDGGFRADLFYRIGVVTLTVPPLRERRDDIPDLVREFLAYFRTQIPTQVTDVDDSGMRALMAYGWPGNIRELINVVERAVLISDSAVLGLRDLPDAIRGEIRTVEEPSFADSGAELGGAGSGMELPLKEARARVVASFEREYLTRQLERAEGRISVTARRAGITPRALHEKMRRHGLRKEDFKP